MSDGPDAADPLEERCRLAGEMIRASSLTWAEAQRRMAQGLADLNEMLREGGYWRSIGKPGDEARS